MVAIAGRSALPNAKRVVVKVGSTLLVDEDKNTINKELDVKYDQLKNDVVLKGFRPGKVPKDLIIVSANGGMVDVKIDSPFLVSTF